jgi:hypothetical protein
MIFSFDVFVRRFIYPFMFLATLPVVAFCQSSDARSNQVMVEVGGNCGLISLNYERIIFDEFAFRIGAGYLAIFESASERGKSSDGYLWMPTAAATLCYLVGESAVKFEAGGGLFIHLNKANACKAPFSKSCSVAGFTGILAYRHQPKEGGFTFRFALTPFTDFHTFILSLGASFGWSF